MSNAGKPVDEGNTTVNVRVPTQLRSLTGGAGEVPVEGSTVGDVLAALETSHPGFGERLFDESGKLRRFVNVFVADEDVRFLQGLDTPVSPGQTLSIVPAVAGGCQADVIPPAGGSGDASRGRERSELPPPTGRERSEPDPSEQRDRGR